MRPTLLLAGSLFALASTQASALPLYYTLEGSIFDIQSNAQVSGYAVGQAVRYVFLVDTDLPGYETYAGGQNAKVDIGVPGADAYTAGYFYAAYAGGDALADDGAGRDPAASHNFGYDLNSNGFHIGALSVSNFDASGYDYLEALSAGRYFTDWAVGTSGIVGTNYMDDNLNSNLSIQSLLTVTSISDVNPVAAPAVPEPAAMALFGLGLLGLGVAARRRRG